MARGWPKTCRAKVVVTLGLKMIQNCGRKLLENGEARAEVDCSDLAMCCDQLVALVGSL